MKILKNKKIIIPIIILTIIIIATNILFTVNELKNNQRITSNVIAGIIGNIEKNYPNVSEEEIISILNSENEEIEDVVRNNEPSIALYAKNNGLEYYESIFKNASKILKDKYLIALEIGQTQGENVKKIALTYLNNVKVEIKKDLSLKNRMVFVYNY